MAKIPKHKLSGKFALNTETLIRKVKDNKRDSIAVEIGDSRQPDFKPQFKVSRWNNEVNFSIRAEEHPSATVDIDGDVIKYITPLYEVHQYEKPEAGEDGGFEFEWIVPIKPESNVLTATIRTKELDFFYQPALTGEEIESGALRPDNVVGSYAVYHRLNKNNHYKTGKAFHIYRPEAIDANGNKTWCELYIDIDTEVLTVTIPEKFLESAAYPVVVDPTFGYTSVGASTTSVATNLPSTIRVGNQAVLSEDGVISSINVALRATGTTQNVDTSVFLNTENTTTDSHTLVAFQERTLLPVTTTATFYNFDVSGSVTAGDYVISVVCDGNDVTNTVSVMYDAVSSHPIYSESFAGGTPYVSAKEDPWTETDTSSTNTYSLYIDYNLFIDGDISLASGTTGFDISLTGATALEVSVSDSITITEDVTVAKIYNKIETFVDDFNDGSIGAAWTNWGGVEVTESGGFLNQLVNSGGANYQGLESAGQYDATDSYARLEIIDAGNQSLTSLEVTFAIIADSNNKVFLLITGNNLVAYKRVSGSNTYLTQTSFSLDNQRFLRLRETSGTTYWEYSGNGTSWTTLHSEATPISLSVAQVEIVSGVYASEASSTTAIFDNLNVDVVALPTPFEAITITEDVVLDLVAGTTTYTVDTFDAISITESVTAEEVTFVDTFDAIGITESVTTEVISTINTSDSIGITEAITVEQIFFVDTFDSISIAENTSVEKVIEISASENISITESVSNEVSTSIDTFDSISIVDSVTDLLISIDLDTFELITISDVASVVIEGGGFAGDDITITEDVQVLLIRETYTLEVNDSISITESVDTEFTYAAVVSTDVAISEAVTLENTQFVSTSDSVSITEQTTQELTADLTTSESISISESVENSITWAASVSDSISITESTISDSAYLQEVNDSIGITESVQTEVTSSVSVSTDVTISEDVSIDFDGSASVNTSVSISDVATVELVKEVSVNDSLTISETQSFFLEASYIVDVFDMIELLEDITSENNTTLSLVDQVSISEDINQNQIFDAQLLWDSIVLTDTVTDIETIRFSPEPPKYRPRGLRGDIKRRGLGGKDVNLSWSGSAEKVSGYGSVHSR